jgi:hypothetical protein
LFEPLRQFSHNSPQLRVSYCGSAGDSCAVGGKIARSQDSGLDEDGEEREASQKLHQIGISVSEWRYVELLIAIHSLAQPITVDLPFWQQQNAAKTFPYRRHRYARALAHQ